MSWSRSPICLTIAVLSLVSVVQGEEAAQFRGPEGNGAFAGLAHPSEWGAEANLAWTSEIPGGGWSSPIAVGDRVFVTTAVSTEIGRPKGFGPGVAAMRSFSRAKPPEKPVRFEVHCLQLADGKRLWSKTIAEAKLKHVVHPSNSYATESPTSDGKRVYVYFAAIGRVACLDLEGKEQWQREVGVYSTSNNFGTGSSLAQDGDLVFLQSDNQEQSFVLAMDAKTGKDAWRRDRDSRTCWSSPWCGETRSGRNWCFAVPERSLRTIRNPAKRFGI